MKATGVTRKLDDLGRIVLPIELRRVLDLKEDDSLAIYVEGTDIILKKYVPGCIFCGEVTGAKDFKGKKVCPNCANEM